MTDQTARYDRIAEGYARWWAPVLAPSVERLIDRVVGSLPDGPVRVLDVGTGTGQLGIGLLERTADTSVVGIDASSEMIAIATTEADRRLSGAARDRFDVRVAAADRLPFADGSFDLALASFVLQLVPHRPSVLREIRRVLRPGGRFVALTWVQGHVAFEPDEIFDDLLDEIGIGARESDGPSGDFASVDRAANELRRAGFREVTAVPDSLEHAFDVDGYVGFMVSFDEETLIADLENDERTWFLAALRERLEGLAPDRLCLRLPTVVTDGRRAGP
jgi:ubiquinone/menaquinone biosynthesis C-methylase UbiE